MSHSIGKKRNVSKHLPKTGTPASSPGTIKYIGKKREEEVQINMIDYIEGDYTEKNIFTIILHLNKVLILPT